MITNPARYALDAAVYMKTLEESERDAHFNDLIPDICELESETASRIMFAIMNTFADMSPDNFPNFELFHKKHGLYVIQASSNGNDTQFRRLYTEEEANAK